MRGVFVLGKVVAWIISPLGTSMLVGGFGLLLQRRGVWLVRMALLWLWLWSTPLASMLLRGWIEGKAGPGSVEEVLPAEVIVVLGGGVGGAHLPFRQYPDLGPSSDRVWHAARLFKAGKGKRVLLSGGAALSGGQSEAGAMRRFLLELGVPDGFILLETSSTNTRSNARFVREMLAKDGVPRVILVTSALHMPRARRIFERAGFDVAPAPTDFEFVGVTWSVWAVLPDAAALEGSARAMKEILGYLLVR